MSYDVAYQDWLAARHASDYKRADAIREQFERDNKLTIFAEGEAPLEGVTVRRMKVSDWESKYGNAEVARIIAATDSRVKMMFPNFRGTLKV